jgi:hypothetical protein
MITYRNTSQALTYGTIELIDNIPSHSIAFKRSTETEEVLVFHNISNKSITIQLPEEFITFSNITFTSDELNALTQHALRLNPYTTLILSQ